MLPENVRIFLCKEPISMRRSFEGLSTLVEQLFPEELFSGSCFVFLNKNRSHIKILFWDRDGFTIFYKRLEIGSLKMGIATKYQHICATRSRIVGIERGCSIGLFLKCFNAFVTSCVAPGGSGWSNNFPGRVQTYEIQNAFQGAHNNPAERAIRPLAIGRKNWFFVGSKESGEAAATLLSLTQTCRALNINPRVYLEDVCRRMMGHSLKKLHELLPDEWLKAPLK